MLAWSLFVLLILCLLALDLFVFHRKSHKDSLSTALKWTGMWISIGLSFGGVLYLSYANGWFGLEHPGGAKQAAYEYYAAYLVEKSLSFDNIFVMVLIFSRFRIPAKYQHRVLFWGILGAVVFRGIMVGLGTKMLENFSWAFYVFGALLFVVALKMLFDKQDEEEDFDSNWMVRLVRKVLPIGKNLNADRFLVREDGKLLFTPLFLVLMVIEFSDVLFAVDSIPACFSVTVDPFIVYSSNIFAILGLRSLYFAVADLVHRFDYLKYSLVALLMFVSAKMLLMEHYHISTGISLLVILGLLVVGVVFSLIMTSSSARDTESEL